MMFELLVGTIGAPLAQFLARQWLGDSAGGAIAGGTIDYLESRLGSEREARRAARQVEDLAERIVDGLEPYFEQEQKKGFELQPVILQLELTLDRRATAGVVVANRLDAAELYDHWLKSRPEAIRVLSDNQAEAYRVLVPAIAAGLCAIVEKLPRCRSLSPPPINGRRLA